MVRERLEAERGREEQGHRRPLAHLFHEEKRRSLLSRTQKFESPFPLHFPIERLYATL